MSVKLLALVTDAYGGRGGIAKFNRDFFDAVSRHPAVDSVVALPRLICDHNEVNRAGRPSKVDFRAHAARGTRHYARALCQSMTDRYDGVVCGHVNLLPLAAIAAAWRSVPLLLVAHGIEVWRKPGFVRRLLARQLDAVVAVSEFTRGRLMHWAGQSVRQDFIVPNCIDASSFGIGDARDDLVDRYGLRGRTVMLTVGRLSAAERYKGIDRVIGVLPQLAREQRDIAYLVVGDGGDRARLEMLAKSLNVRDRVVFAGYVSEQEKADHYRLADVFVMPGWGEGFGIVYLEALACGIPVVASSADASREVVLDGVMGEIVDPDQPAALVAGIMNALARPRPVVPPELEFFSVERFRERWCTVIDVVFAGEVAASRESAALARENERRPAGVGAG